MKSNDGKLYVIAGASRSGKTVRTYRQTRHFPRVIVWDIEGQWCMQPGFVKVTTRRELLRMTTQNKGPHKIAYVAGGDIQDEFNFFCGCAYYWGRYLGPCAVVAEELADVSTPAKAPQEWGILLRRGLKRGITIFAISQRWAEADKTTLGNASIFWVFRTIGDDTRYMSRKTSVNVAILETLKPLEYVEIDAATGKTKREKVKF